MMLYGDRSGAVIEPWLSTSVRRCQDLGPAAIQAGRGRPYPLRAQALGEHLFRVDEQHPALVYLAADLVGPSGPGLVRAGRYRVRRGQRDEAQRRRTSTMAGRSNFAATAMCSTRGSPPPCGRSRRWAGRPTPPRSSATIPPTFWSPASTSSSLGRPHDDGGPALNGRGALPHRLHPCAGPRREGQKMSKSKGNVIDPLVLMTAVRHRRPALHPDGPGGSGRDLRMSEGRVEGYRNFATKLWNAARFCEMNGCHPVADFVQTAAATVHRWIVGKLAATAAEVETAIEAFRFNDAASVLYTSPGARSATVRRIHEAILQGENVDIEHAPRRGPPRPGCSTGCCTSCTRSCPTSRGTMAAAGREAPSMLISSAWPTFEATSSTPMRRPRWTGWFAWSRRSGRCALNARAPGARIPTVPQGGGGTHRQRLAIHRDLVVGLGRLGSAETVEGEIRRRGSGRHRRGDDRAADCRRNRRRPGESALQKEISRLDGEIAKFEKNCRTRASSARPREVVEEQKEKCAEAVLARDKWRPPTSGWRPFDRRPLRKIVHGPLDVYSFTII